MRKVRWGKRQREIHRGSSVTTVKMSFDLKQRLSAFINPKKKKKKKIFEDILHQSIFLCLDTFLSEEF